MIRIHPAIFAVLIVVGCSAEVTTRRPPAGPPSLAVAPPWMYSARPPARPRLPRRQEEALPPAPQAPSPGRPSAELSDRLDDLQDAILDLRRELAP